MDPHFFFWDELGALFPMQDIMEKVAIAELTLDRKSEDRIPGWATGHGPGLIWWDNQLFNGNSRILEWSYCTIFLAIEIGGISPEIEP